MKRILVAEDDLSSRELLVEILHDWGYEVVEAVNGLEALQQIEARPPDLVLLDIQMPVLDGFAVLKRIRQNPRLARLPIVAVTAYAMREDREKITSSGFNGHLSKPVDLLFLRDLLDRGVGAPAGMTAAPLPAGRWDRVGRERS